MNLPKNLGLTPFDVMNVVARINQDLLGNKETAIHFEETPLQLCFDGNMLSIRFLGLVVWEADDCPALVLPYFGHGADEAFEDEDPEEGYVDADQLDYDSSDLENDILRSVHRRLSFLTLNLRNPGEPETGSGTARNLEIIIRGRSGSGKTTAAKIISAEFEKWGLDVKIDDKEAVALSTAQCAQSLAGLQSLGTTVLVRTEKVKP